MGVAYLLRICAANSRSCSGDGCESANAASVGKPHSVRQAFKEGHAIFALAQPQGYGSRVFHFLAGFLQEGKKILEAPNLIYCTLVRL